MKMYADTGYVEASYSRMDGPWKNSLTRQLMRKRILRVLLQELNVKEIEEMYKMDFDMKVNKQHIFTD